MLFTEHFLSGLKPTPVARMKAFYHSEYICKFIREISRCKKVSMDNEIYNQTLDVALSIGDLDLLVAFWKLAAFLPTKEEIHDKINSYTPTLAQRMGFVCYEENFCHFLTEVYDQEMAYEILSGSTESVVTYLKQGDKHRAKKVGKVLCTDVYYEKLDRDKCTHLSRVIGISLTFNTNYVFNRHLLLVGTPTQAWFLCGAFEPYS